MDESVFEMANFFYTFEHHMIIDFIRKNPKSSATKICENVFGIKNKSDKVKPYLSDLIEEKIILEESGSRCKIYSISSKDGTIVTATQKKTDEELVMPSAEQIKQSLEIASGYFVV